MSSLPAGLGVVVVTAGLALAVLAGSLTSLRALRLLSGRFVKMVPTTIAYESLFVAALLIETANGTAAVDPVVALSGSLALACSLCGSWYMNDVFDVESDRRSSETRVTATGRVTDRQTLVTALALWVASLGYAAVVNGAAVVGVAGMIGLNLAYSVPPLRLKRTGTGSMVCIGSMGAIATLLGGVSVGPALSPLVWRLAAVVTVFMMVNLSYKDLKDAEEDAQTGVRNFVVRFGRDRMRWFFTVSLPASYLLGAAVLGITHPLALAAVAVVGFTAVTLLWTHDLSDAALVYRLDVINAVYVLSLAGSYYAIAL